MNEEFKKPRLILERTIVERKRYSNINWYPKKKGTKNVLKDIIQKCFPGMKE